MTQLRQRMINDMTVRGLDESTKDFSPRLLARASLRGGGRIRGGTSKPTAPSLTAG